MMFRAYVRQYPAVQVTKFTIDVQASSGFNPVTGFGAAPLPGNAAAPALRDCADKQSLDPEGGKALLVLGDFGYFDGHVHSLTQ